MGLIEDIAQLMLREGEIKAQEGRERIAADEEQRQAKHRALKMTLKYLATYGPYFIPGAGIIPALVKTGISVAGSQIPTSSSSPQIMMHNPSVNRWDEGPADQFDRIRRSYMDPLPSRQTVPPWDIPWDEEGVG